MALGSAISIERIIKKLGSAGFIPAIMHSATDRRYFSLWLIRLLVEKPALPY